MMLRLVLEKRHGNTEAASALITTSSVKCQRDESQRLYDLIILCKGKLKSRTLTPVLHRLLGTVLQPPSLPDKDIACPTELMILVTSLTKTGFRTAASVKQLCCRLQFCFRIIYLHTARLDGFEFSEYQPFLESNAGM